MDFVHLRQKAWIYRSWVFSLCLDTNYQSILTFQRYIWLGTVPLAKQCRYNNVISIGHMDVWFFDVCVVVCICVLCLSNNVKRKDFTVQKPGNQFSSVVFLAGFSNLFEKLFIICTKWKENNYVYARLERLLPWHFTFKFCKAIILASRYFRIKLNLKNQKLMLLEFQITRRHFKFFFWCYLVQEKYFSLVVMNSNLCCLPWHSSRFLLTWWTIRLTGLFKPSYSLEVRAVSRRGTGEGN